MASPFKWLTRNYLCIGIFQILPSKLSALRAQMKGQTLSAVSEPSALIEGINYVGEEGKSKRALLMLSPDAWGQAVQQYPHIRMYNHVGLTYSLVTALNENGYLVDIADYRYEHFPVKAYDLFVGHGGHCRTILDNLAPEVPVYQYVSGGYCNSFNKESEERYDRFYKACGAEKPTTFKRSLDGITEGEVFLTKNASVLFTIHCPRMAKAYGEHSEKFYFSGLGAYKDKLFHVSCGDRNYESGRKNFIYVGGTGGNLQKGLDVLLAAFSKTPEFHLYIYCKVEEEILLHCAEQLILPNIHYICHWRYKQFQGKLKKLLKETVFSLHAPINTGLGTAFSATLGEGMIPVGYIDLAEPRECAVLTDSWEVDALVECIRRASEKSPEWCEQAAELSKGYYAKHCDPDQVYQNFKTMFAGVKDKYN